MLSHDNILSINEYKDLSLEQIESSICLDLYYFMKRLRMTEEALAKEYHPADEMRCPVHFCIGQEVAPAALNKIMKNDDYLFSHHRSHGYYLAKNAPIEKMFAELYGKQTGSNGGIAGSQDISFQQKNFYSGAILAGAIAVAIGTALSLKYRGSEQNVFVGFGESATDEGIFWEAINYSVLKKLPIIFVCENNNYSVYSPQRKRQAGKSISNKVKSFGVNSDVIFGNDVTLAYKKIFEASEISRSESQPYFLEMITSRWSAHYGPENDDNIGYRDKGELDFWMRNCPIKLLRNELIKNKILDTDIEQKTIEKYQNEINKSFEFAKSSPFPNFNGWDNLNYSKETPLSDKLLEENEDPNKYVSGGLTTPKGY